MAKDASSGLPAAQGASVKALFASTNQLASVALDDPQEVLSASSNILNSYYTVALAQSARSFVWALVGAGVGLLFFMAAVTFLLMKGSAEAAIVSAIGGAIVEVVSGLLFYLYGKTTDQAASHRSSLEKMQRYLLANSIIESLTTDEEKDESRTKLVSSMTDGNRNAPRRRGDGERQGNHDSAPAM
jgi:phosphoribosylformylglycinamidine (FGAM) synthase PurS component